MGINLCLRQDRQVVGTICVPHCVNQRMHILGFSAAHVDGALCSKWSTQAASLLRRLKGSGALDPLPGGATCWCWRGLVPSTAQIRHCIYHHVVRMYDLATQHPDATWQIYLRD